jgi:predicted ester cyclase
MLENEQIACYLAYQGMIKTAICLLYESGRQIQFQISAHEFQAFLLDGRIVK